MSNVTPETADTASNRWDFSRAIFPHVRTRTGRRSGRLCDSGQPIFRRSGENVVSIASSTFLLQPPHPHWRLKKKVRVIVIAGMPRRSPQGEGGGWRGAWPSSARAVTAIGG
ncbi:MAG: hypothetical protein M9963_11870, partial [Kiritimatiellae bacterium]|nr:hypothetical protein [Kiritimatiellia bacterium]